MILVKQKNNSFWENFFSSALSVFLGVTGTVNVILLLPGLNSLQESVYSIEMDVIQSALIAPLKFIPAFIFTFISLK